MKALYLIALIPPPALREEVRLLKEEMSERFQARHALKSPAHITLQMPFRRSEAAELGLLTALYDFVALRYSFTVQLSGFDCFKPRVIFLRVVDHTPILLLRNDLKQLLVRDLGFAIFEINHPFHPHLTIATRDLTGEAFGRAWPEYRERSFEAQFEAEAVHVLKHDGKNWAIYRELKFGGK